MNPLYNFGISVYASAARLLSLRNAKVKKMVEGQKRTFDYLRGRLGSDSGCVWIHAASLGEFEQGRPMIERLRREHPEKKILLTFFSPSGYEVRKNYPEVDAVAYLPFDTPGNARRFIDIVRPSKAIFVKYEFWGNYLEQLAEHNIPTYIISAIFRPTQIFFRPYGGIFRRMLRNFTRLYLQDDNSRRLLSEIGIENTVVAGDTRFDRVTDIMRSAAKVNGAELLGAGSKLKIVFGSSWPDDEEKYIAWLNAHPEVFAIVAPHEFNEARITDLCSRIEGNVMRLSQWEKAFSDDSAPKQDVEKIRGIVVDCFGKLSSLYRYGDAAYIGGGFGAGIHNINEAAVYSIPVIFGPNHAKFKEASDLIRLGGAFSVADAVQAQAVLTRMLSEPECRKAAGEAAGHYIADNIGATDRIYSEIFPATH